MTISSYRASEPLYIVIVRDKNAEQLLKNWAKDANVQVSVDSNRMKIFEQRGLTIFQMQWKHGWENVVIWDAWNKRHIDID